MKIAINGFGRIGRAFFRNFYNNKLANLEIVQINDVCDFDKLIYLLREDSIYGHFKHTITHNNNELTINNNTIKLSKYKNPQEFKTNADIIIECSGKFDDKQMLQSYLDNGASYAILGATPKDDMDIYICGVNEHTYNGAKIISNASCTSNAIAPIIKAINEKCNILSGNISIIHPFNNDQSLLDSPHNNNIRLSRNATMNIIPTTSSIGNVLKKMFNIDFYGDSIRIPTSIVAFSNIDLVLDRKLTKDEILNLKFNSNIVGIDDNMLVSSDFIGDKRSAIIASDLININNNVIRIGIWFDNENGYANRLIDMIDIIHKYHKSQITHHP